MTDCNDPVLEFQAHNGRKVVMGFDGGDITSDAGAMLLRQTDQRLDLLERFAACFEDHRDPDLIEHSVLDLASQRVFGLCLGYEDLNDHDDLRRDRLLALAVGKKDITGNDRLRKRDEGIALAGKSTLNRLEQVPAADEPSRYQKIGYDPFKVDRLMTDVFLESHASAPKRIYLDLDNTDAPIHGDQEGRFFHGYYGNYCYMPLYIFCGEQLLLCRLQSSNVDGAAHAIIEVRRIVEQIRSKWPEVEIVLRGDSGFCRDPLMSWCENNGVSYIFGMSTNARLDRMIRKQLNKSRGRTYVTGKSSRRYRGFWYRTQKTWDRKRWIIGKAEYLEKGENPRFIVTNLRDEGISNQKLYEEIYCARGEMENRIKEQQMGLFADRVSAEKMRSNQLRLYFSGMGYILMETLRRLGLKGTEYSKAQCTTIREKVLKVGAQIKMSVRRIVLSLASGYPHKEALRKIFENLQAPLPCLSG